MKRTIVRLLAVVAMGLAVLAAPSTAVADGPAEELVALAKHVDAALERLAANDFSGARSEDAAFDDGWGPIEDGIRDQSVAHYTAIEAAMGDAKYALQADPFDADRARSALERLRKACDAFISGAPATAERPAQQGSVTIRSTVGRLDAALSLLDANDAAGAAAQVSAFRIDWIEVEGLVKAKSAKVYTSTENNMAKAYSQLTQRTSDTAGARETLTRMKADLAPFAQGEARYGVFDAAIILLREGFEALLIVGALLAFLRKTGNAAKGRWIWAGSGVGVFASMIVAFIVNIALSATSAGANRELLEGVTGLVAAGMLLWVSFWLHSKSSLGAWQRYISDKTSSALARNSLMSLSLIAFLAVFREGAETVLFYIGIAPATATGDLLLGVGLGAAGLGVIGLLVLLFGVRIPIRPFFLGTSLLVYYLAFKFVGSGIHALQVSGKLQATPSDILPSSGLFGVFPTWESTIVQVALLAAAVGVLAWSRLRRSSHAETLSST